MIAAMLISPLSVFAAEPEEDMPSEWAIRELVLAAMYGLADEEALVGYKQAVPFERFEAIHGALCTRVEVADELAVPVNGVLTRGYVMAELFDIARQYCETSLDALGFFVSNGLVSGRGGVGYAENEECTTQEAILFAKRVLEFLCNEFDAASTGFLWRVSDADNTVYLLGSVHLADAQLFPLSERIMAAYEAAGFICVEIDITQEDPEELMQIYMGFGLYFDDETLADVLDAETYAAVGAALEPYGISEAVYSRMKPWYVTQLISSLTVYDDYAQGVDAFLMTLAQLDGKPIYALESSLLQIAVMASLSEETQIAQLQSALSGDVEMSRLMLDAMIGVWRLGDEDLLKMALGRENATGEASLEYLQKMNTERNVSMIAQVKYILDAMDEDALVVVGAMHMLYEDGIVAAMESAGYTVERVK